MEVKNLILLSPEEWQKEKKLLKNKSLLARITDFGILTGGYVSSDFHVEQFCLEDRTGYYFTQSSDFDRVEVINDMGSKGLYYVNERKIGIRPVLEYEGAPANYRLNEKGEFLLEYGTYPTKVVRLPLQKSLEEKYQQKELEEGTKTIHIQDKILPTYLFLEQEYVRVPANFNKKTAILSNRQGYVQKDDVWVQVTPLYWMLDLDNKRAISENILIAGLPYCNSNNQNIIEYFNPLLLEDIKVKTKRKD